jgi:hypothetical protein
MTTIKNTTGTNYSSNALDECITPNTNEQPLVNIVQGILGGTICLDPCSNPEKSIPALKHFTSDEDGLTELWLAESVYMFPPSSNAHLWFQKLAYHFKNGDISKAVALLEVSQLSSKGTGSLVESCASCIALWGAGKTKKLSFPNGSLGAISYIESDMVLVYLGEPPNKFVNSLIKFASIYVPF